MLATRFPTRALSAGRPRRRAISASRRARLVIRVSSTSSSSMPGWRRRSPSSRSIRKPSASVRAVVSRTGPTGPSSAWSSRRSRAIAPASIASASASTAVPAAFGR